LDKIVSNRVKDSCISLINVLFLCVVCWDFCFFNTISDRLGVCHFRSSFGYLWCGGAFVLLSRYICKTSTFNWLRWSKSCSYDFLIYFAASVASRMRFSTV
jgi:hypothetical protein